MTSPDVVFGGSALPVELFAAVVSAITGLYPSATVTTTSDGLFAFTLNERSDDEADTVFLSADPG